MTENEIRLKGAMSELTKREVFALTAYIELAKDAKDMEMLRMEAYCFSRTVEPASPKETIQRKTDLWFEKDSVKAFLEAKIQSVHIENGKTAIKIEEGDETPEEALVKELEDIKEQVKSKITADGGKADKETMDMLIKTIREIHNIRYKSKNQIKDDARVVQLMIPVQCIECPLYAEAKRKLK